MSRSDHDFVVQNMKQLFPEVTNHEERHSIMSRLLAIQEPIPSLYTLIRRARYLKEPGSTPA